MSYPASWIRGTDTSAAAPDPVTTPRKKRGAGIISWLALLLAVLALVAIGLDYQRDQSSAGETAQSDAELRTLTASINATQNSLLMLEQNVSALSDLDTEQKAAIDRFGRQLGERLQQLESLPDGWQLSKLRCHHCRESRPAPGMHGCLLRRNTTCKLRTPSCNLRGTRNWRRSH